jgi:CheY-like chemotaxis protein
MVTTENDPADRQRAKDHGAVAYLTKPLQVPAFLEVVNRVLK